MRRHGGGSPGGFLSDAFKVEAAAKSVNFTLMFCHTFYYSCDERGGSRRCLQQFGKPQNDLHSEIA